MLLLHSLLKAATCFSFMLAASHVSGRNNSIADALSHFNFQAFHPQAPHAKTFSSPHPSSALSPVFHCDLEAHCLLFMYRGLAASTCRTCYCAQEKFINIWVVTGQLSPKGSPCPASEWILCLFATYLANSLQHSFIKVYLSAVRSLHVYHGFPGPLEHCIQLQRVVRGIKHSQDALPSKPTICDNILCMIYSAPDLNSFDDVIFWAVCLLAYFCFLWSAKFTAPNLSAFNLSLHLSVSDVSVDIPLNPSCIQVFIKASKTNPFQKGFNVLIGLGSPPLRAVQAVVSYWACHGNCPVPLFLLEN